MQIPLPVKCASCDKPATHRIHLNQTSFEWTCTACGHVHPTFLDLELTVGFLLLERSRYELQEEEDYSMSIILAAIAFDCELSRLYYKWRRIADLQANQSFDEEACEESLLNFRNFINKLNGVSNLLYPNGGIEAFVKSSAEFTETLTRFPSLHVTSLAKDFHSTVFKPRNRILHQGIADFNEADASKCYSIAWLGLRICQAMDIAKRAAL